MNIIYKYDYTKAGLVANELARARGYDGFGSIDDPLLREWIWEQASAHIKRVPRVEASLPEALTPVIIISALFLLLGIL